MVAKIERPSTEAIDPARGRAPATRPLIGVAAGAAVGSAAVAAALIFAGRLKNPFVDAASADSTRPLGRGVKRNPPGSAAFASDVEGSGTLPVRDAGPYNMRDPETGRDWDGIDEASDESFPASDPPSY